MDPYVAAFVPGGEGTYWRFGVDELDVILVF
jgi:hypothetical protein